MADMARATRKMQKRILHGPIVRTLFQLGWPIMATQFFQMAYNLIDMYWLGKTGSIGLDPVKAVAAPSLAWPLVFLFVSLASGMSVAGTALVSQYTGARNKEEVRRSAGQVLSLLTIIAISISIAGFLLTDTILAFMGAEPGLQEIASPYIKLIFGSMPFMFITMVYSSALRGWGDMKTPMYIMMFSLSINIILDPLFIFGLGGMPRLGVAGAGAATLAARSIAALICLYLFFNGNSLTIRRSDLKLVKERVMEIVRIGIPASIGQAMVAFGFVILMGIVATTYSDIPGAGQTTALAAYGVGNRIINMVFVLTSGLTGASVTMMGQNLGAGRMKRAERVLYRTMAVTAMLLFTCAVIFFVFRELIFRVFINDRAVIEEGGRLLMIFGMSIFMFGIFGSAQSAFQASGHTVPTMILGIVRLWGLRVPLVILLAIVLDWGSVGIWTGMMLSNVISALLAVAWVSRGTWKRRITEKKPGARGHISGHA